MGAVGREHVFSTPMLIHFVVPTYGSLISSLARARVRHPEGLVDMSFRDLSEMLSTLRFINLDYPAGMNLRANVGHWQLNTSSSLIIMLCSRTSKQSFWFHALKVY